MLTYPHIDPVALAVGPVKIHWYGIMYLVGFVGGWWLGVRRAAKPNSGWRTEEIGDLLFYVAMGVVLGGRLGFVLFYDLASYIEEPLRILKVWQGGMSFHGGLLGVITAMWLYGRKTQRRFFVVADFVAPLIPIGLLTGRIGNFINGELWGKVTDVPWAMVFPTGGPLPRHPSQLYEAALEGLALLIILLIYSRKPRPTMAVSGLFLMGYGIFRFSVEFVRVPDENLGYLFAEWITMGQLLSAPMVLFGLFLMVSAYRNNKAAP